MKRILLGGEGQFYKTNLHCHTTLSDGRLTPQEVKELYKSQGYSVVAFTDHDVLIPHPELRDEGFLPLNAIEFAVRNKSAYREGKDPCVHLNFIALEEDNVTTPLYHRTKHVTKESSRELLTFDPTLPDYERCYSVGMINDAIRRAKALGFFVIYNHPTWSFENADRILQYENLDAYEIYNHSSTVIGYEEYTPALFDHLNRAGKQLLPVATDDNHNKYPFGHKGCDACGGYTMIHADALEYRKITSALQAGDFYASNGAVIHEIYVEDGVLTVKCERGEKVILTVEYGSHARVYAEDGPLTKASFKLPENRGWVRVTVYDDKGKFAASRPFFPEEWERK